MKRGLKASATFNHLLQTHLYLNEKRIEREVTEALKYYMDSLASMKRGLKVNWSEIAEKVKNIISMKRGLKVDRCTINVFCVYMNPQWKEDWKEKDNKRI